MTHTGDDQSYRVMDKKRERLDWTINTTPKTQSILVPLPADDWSEELPLRKKLTERRMNIDGICQRGEEGERGKRRERREGGEKGNGLIVKGRNDLERFEGGWGDSGLQEGRGRKGRLGMRSVGSVHRGRIPFGSKELIVSSTLIPLIIESESIERSNATHRTPNHLQND